MSTYLSAVGSDNRSQWSYVLFLGKIRMGHFRFIFQGKLISFWIFRQENLWNWPNIGCDVVSLYLPWWNTAQALDKRTILATTETTKSDNFPSIFDFNEKHCKLCQKRSTTDEKVVIWNETIWVQISQVIFLLIYTGCFFNWCPPKNHMFFPVSKFWHFELFWLDILCNLTLRTFRGAPVKKNTLYHLNPVKNE